MPRPGVSEPFRPCARLCVPLAPEECPGPLPFPCVVDLGPPPAGPRGAVCRCSRRAPPRRALGSLRAACQWLVKGRKSPDNPVLQKLRVLQRSTGLRPKVRIAALWSFRKTPKRHRVRESVSRSSCTFLPPAAAGICHVARSFSRRPASHRLHPSSTWFIVTRGQRPWIPLLLTPWASCGARSRGGEGYTRACKIKLSKRGTVCVPFMFLLCPVFKPVLFVILCSKHFDV